MKIRPVGGEFHADGETDMTQLIVAFRNFANAPKNLAFFPQRKTSYLSDSFKWFVFVVETRCVSGGRD